MRSRNPIFVMGHPRAGTSITTWVLGQHPEIQYHFEETGCFNLELQKLVRSPFRWVALDNYCSFIKPRLNESEKAALAKFTEDSLLISDIYLPLRQFLDTCLMNQPNKYTFIEKTPLHIFYADLIRRVYPDSIFLIPHRPEEQVIKSMDTKSWSPRSPIAKELFYDIIDTEIDYVMHKLDKVYYFDFEKFCLSPESVIQFLIECGIEREGFDKVYAAHKRRVDVKYLTQDKQDDGYDDQEKRMAQQDDRPDTFE